MLSRLIGNAYWFLGGLAIVMVLLPVIAPGSFYLRVAALVYINAIAVIGLNLLMGYAGQVSLGHAGFFGIGAYTVTLGPAVFRLPVWASLVAGVVFSGVLAFIIGRPILKLRGFYFAVATLGLGLLIWMFFNNQSDLTGGPNGMQVPRLVLFGWRAAGTFTWYWISAATLAFAAWLALNLINSPTGRAFRAIHDSEIAARTLGVDIARYKLLAFVLSAVYGCGCRFISVAVRRLCDARLRFFPSFDRIRRHGCSRRARVDLRQHCRRGAARCAPAGAYLLSRV